MRLRQIGWVIGIRGRSAFGHGCKKNDVFEQALTRFGAGFILFVMNQLSLQGREERSHRGIVPAVPCAAYGTRDAMFCQQALIVLASELHATVGVGHEIRTGTLTTERHLQSVDHEATVDPVRHGPADDLPRKQVFVCRQVQPAFVGGHVGVVVRERLQAAREQRQALLRAVQGLNRTLLVA